MSEEVKALTEGQAKALWHYWLVLCKRDETNSVKVDCEDLASVFDALATLAAERDALKQGFDADGCTAAESCCGDVKAALVEENERLKAERDSAVNETARRCAVTMCAWCAVKGSIQDIGDGKLEHISKHGSVWPCKAYKIRCTFPLAFAGEGKT